MKLSILIFLVVIVSVCAQTTKKTTTKPTTKPPAKTTTKPAPAKTTTKPAPAKTTTKPAPAVKTTTKAPAAKTTTKAAPITKAAPTTTTDQLVAAPIPFYTCNNVSGMAKFDFSNFATGSWYLWQELGAWPFSYAIGQCVAINFSKDPKNPKSSMVVFNSLIDGAFTDSPASSIKVGVKDGINLWDVKQVGLKTDAMSTVSDLKFVVIDTDYKNWAAVYACGTLCVYMDSKVPSLKSADCSPGDVYQHQILLRSRTFDQATTDKYVKLATDALNAKWPYMTFVPIDQNAQMCTPSKG